MEQPSVPRIEPLAPPYAPGVEEKLQQAAPPWRNEASPLFISRIWGTYPKLGEVVSKAAVFLLKDGELEPADRELLLLRILALTGAEYEWGVHACGYAARSGLSNNTIEATFSAVSSAREWSERERLLVRLADEFELSADLSDELWAQLQVQFTDRQLLELMLVAGFYRFVAFTANSTRIPLETWAPRFPRDRSTEEDRA